jgi:hypothetical protein
LMSDISLMPFPHRILRAAIEAVFIWQSHISPALHLSVLHGCCLFRPLPAFSAFPHWQPDYIFSVQASVQLAGHACLPDRLFYTASQHCLIFRGHSYAE